MTGVYIGTSPLKAAYVGTTPVKEIYVGTTKVRPSGWQPGANTVAYYPLDSSNTVADLSGNGRNLTNNSVSFGTYQGVSCASVTRRYQRLTSPTISFPKTLSLWTYREGRFNTGGSTLAALFTYGSSSTYKALTYNEKNGNLNTIVGDYGGGVTPISGQRFNLVIVNDSDLKIYVNGNLTGTYTKGTPADYAFYFFAFSTNVNGIDVYYGGLSNVIMENVGWDSAQVKQYYNQTKANYGLGPTVQTFDFQNNGKLNWTAGSWGTGTPDYVTGQGWRIYRSSQDNDGYVYPSSSIFDNNALKRVKIRMYKGIGTTTTKGVGAGICNTAGSKYALWSNVGANYDRITLNGTRIQTRNVTGEVVFILDLSGTNVSFSINGTEYSSSIASSNYTDLWTNKTFALEVANRKGGSGDIYIRKVEITTA